jgi:hypothetical protein
MQITVNGYRDDADPLALYAHYAGQFDPQPVYVSIDTRDGELTIDYDGTVGGGTTEAIYRGVVRCLDVGVIPTADGGNGLLASVAPLAQVWLDAYLAGRDESAGHAWSDLESAVADYNWPERDIVDVWPSDSITSDWISGYDLAGATDEQIEQWADAILAELAANNGGGVAVCDGLVFYMRQVRDEMTAEAATSSSTS